MQNDLSVEAAEKPKVNQFLQDQMIPGFNQALEYLRSSDKAAPATLAKKGIKKNIVIGIIIVFVAVWWALSNFSLFPGAEKLSGRSGAPNPMNVIGSSSVTSTALPVVISTPKPKSTIQNCVVYCYPNSKISPSNCDQIQADMVARATITFRTDWHEPVCDLLVVP